MSEEQPQQPATAMWVKIVLAGSLAVNLLVLGIVGGAFLSPDGPRSQRVDEAARDLGATPFVRSIDPADRRSVFEAFRREAEPLQRNREELRLRFEALLGALKAESFDGDEVASLMALQRTAATERQQIGERILIKYLSGLDREERLAYAKRLEDAVRRGRDRRPDRDK